MSHPTTPEALRNLAYTGIYLLPGAVEGGSTSTFDGEEELRQLPPEQRDRALNMAMRRLAFQLLYELDQSTPAASSASKSSTPDITVTVAESLRGVHDIGPRALEDVQSFVCGAFNARPSADAEFRDLAPEWPTHRQAAVDRALLRLAHYEMTSGRSPAKVVVHETVELAKHFSTEKAPPFINALLDKVMKRIDSSKSTIEAKPTDTPANPQTSTQPDAPAQ